MPRVCRCLSIYSLLVNGVAVGRRSKILDWLSTTKYLAHHRYIRKNSVPGSGKWLLAKKEFQEWNLAEISSIVWLRGLRKLPPFPLLTKILISIASGLGQDVSKVRHNERLCPRDYMLTIHAQAPS